MPLETSNVCPWLPDSNFVESNRQILNQILRQVQDDFPEYVHPVDLELSGATPSSQAMSWMWTHFMGRQHGSLEGLAGKIPLSGDLEASYLPKIGQLTYGPYSFAKPTPINPGKHYTKAYVQGGTPDDMASRLQAAIGHDPHTEQVDDIILMAGQRTRWGTASEATTQSIYAAIAAHTNTDMDNLRAKSPWLKTEEQRPVVDEWRAPFATEFELGRAALEAVFYDVIDWKDYPVTITSDEDANQQSYEFQGERKVVPPRTTSMLTYHLKNNTRVHLLNGRAVARTIGVPRPNSDSQTREAFQLLDNGTTKAEDIVTVVSAPHIRAGMDTIIRLLALNPLRLKTADIVSSMWLPHSSALTALGEIPATHKADLRLRAALAGEDPDSLELSSL